TTTTSYTLPLHDALPIYKNGATQLINMTLMETTAATIAIAAMPELMEVRSTMMSVNTVKITKRMALRYFNAGGISLRETPKGSTRTRCIPTTDAVTASAKTTTATVRYPHQGKMSSDVWM